MGEQLGLAETVGKPGSGGGAGCGLFEELGEVDAGLSRVGEQLRRVGSAERLAAATGGLRRTERLVAALLAEAARVSLGLAATGAGPPPEELLRGAGEVSTGHARADLDRARVADQFTELGSSFRNGDARPDNLDVLARAVEHMTPSEVDALTRHDAALAEAAAVLPPESFGKRVRRLRDRIRNDHGADAAERVRAESYGRVRLSPDKDRAFLSAMFEPVTGAAVRDAVSNEHRRLVRDGDLQPGLRSEQIDAQAISGLILRGADTNPNTLDAGRIGVNINVLVDHHTLTHGFHGDTICETADGAPLSPGTLSRLCCDAAVRRVTTAPDGNVTASRSSRTATPAQRAALLAMYGGCAISGAAWSQVEVHHVRFYEDGGETAIHNLVPISRRWHHLIHDQGWTLTMDTNRTLHLTRPDKTHHRTINPPSPVLHRQAA